MSTRSLGQLTLDLVARTGNFERPMDRASKQAERQFKQMERDGKAAAKSLGLITAAATAAAGAIYAYGKAGMNTIDANAKLARSLDGTLDGLRALRMAAEDNGLDGMEASLNRMNRRLGAVEMKGGPAAKTVERLGLNLKAMQDMDIDERLAYIADQIKATGMSSQEAARHLQQLGFEQRGAYELFMRGGDVIRAAREEMEAYGLSISEIDAAAIEDANTAISKLSLVSESAQNALAIRLAPTLRGVADSLNAVTRAFHAGEYDEQIRLLGSVAVGAGSVAAGYTAMRVATSLATIAQWRLNAAMAANPLGALAIAAGVVTGAMFHFREELGLAQTEIEASRDRVDELTGSIDNLTRAAVQNRISELTADLEKLKTQFIGIEEIGSASDTQRSRGSGVLGVDAGEVGRQARAIRDAVDGVAQGIYSPETQAEIAAFEAAIGSLEKHLESLGDTGGGSGGGGGDTDSKAAAIARQIEALKLQAATLGMTSDQATLYKLALDGATESQLRAASTALEMVSSFKAQQKAAEDYQQLLVGLRTEEEALNAQMHERLAILDAAKVSAEEYGEVLSRIARGAFSDAPEYSGLDAVIGGAFGELNKINEAQEELEEWYATQLEMLDTYRKERADLSEAWDAQERALKEEHENELARIEQARQVAQLQAAQSIFGDLTEMTRAFAGEQSDIYKTMFAIQKAAAIAQSIIAIQQGIAMAAANPWPLNLAAMASVAAATAGLVSNIASVAAPQGMAHDGIDSIPREGTWLLDKGERVLNAPQASKLDRFLDQQQAQDRRRDSGVTVNIIENPERAGQRETTVNADGREEESLFVADIYGDGPRSRAIQNAFGLQRRGR